MILLVLIIHLIGADKYSDSFIQPVFDDLMTPTYQTIKPEALATSSIYKTPAYDFS
jgi:hypothetical protein